MFHTIPNIYIIEICRYTSLISLITLAIIILINIIKISIELAQKKEYKIQWIKITGGVLFVVLAISYGGFKYEQHLFCTETPSHPNSVIVGNKEIPC